MPAITDEEISDSIRQSVLDPQTASADGQTVTDKSIKDKIAGAQFASTTAASSQRRRGIAFSQIIPHGPAPDGGFS